MPVAFEMIKRIVRRASRFAWNEMLFDVARAEWKFGRAKDWKEWMAVRAHLVDAGFLRQPREIDLITNTPKLEKDNGI
jgi:hypothetical protein